MIPKVNSKRRRLGIAISAAGWTPECPRIKVVKVTERTTNIVFAGAEGGTFPATWSQREFWRTINQHRPGGFYQIWLTFHLPESWPLDAIFDLLRFLITRHQALRTKVREDDSGRLWQVIVGDGSLPVRITDLPSGADIDQFTTRVREEFWAAEPDLRRDFPLKLAVVTSGGMARSVVLVCSHGRHERYESQSGPSPIAWELLHSANSDIKVHLRVRLSPADYATVLDLAADESCLTKPEIERTLRAIETLITAAARADFPLSEAHARMPVFS
jgi:hypothetical protein